MEERQQWYQELIRGYRLVEGALLCYYKEPPEGVKHMCEIIRKKGLIEGKAWRIQKTMEKTGLSFGKMCKLFALTGEERSRIEKFLS